MRQSLFSLLLSGLVAALAHSLLSALHIVFQLVEALRNGRFPHDRVGTHAAFQHVRILLHAGLNFFLLQISDGVAKLLRSLRLGAGQAARCVLHLALQVLVVAFHLFFLVRHLRGDLAFPLLVRAILLTTEILAHPLLEILLLIGQPIGLLSDVLHLIAGLLLAHAVQHVASLRQILRSLASVGLSLGLRLGLTLLPTLLALLLCGGRGLTHIASGFAQAAQSLFQLPLLIPLHTAALLLLLLLAASVLLLLRRRGAGLLCPALLTLLLTLLTGL